MDPLSQDLRSVIAEAEPALLRTVSEEAASAVPPNQGWSKKQELGHLLDSATNNRVRFIRASLEGGFAAPSYDGDGWVRMGGHGDAPWSELVDLWAALNRALVRVLDRIPHDRLSATCRVGDNEPVTLAFLIEDYVAHMQHHLDHILTR